MELVHNLGKELYSKKIIISKLESGSFLVLGTPKLTDLELEELLGVVLHEKKYRNNLTKG